MKRLWTFLAVLVVVYAGILAWFSIEENSFVFKPRKGLRNADSVNIGIERVDLQTPDAVHLVCWLIPAATRDSSNTWCLYLHGNSGNISLKGYIDHFKALRSHGINTLAVDYRGFGLSDGRPDENGLYTDARTAFDYLVQKRHIMPRNIVIYGYSLGSAVAIELATQVESEGLIVEGAFTSLPDIGQQQYPYIPVKLIMANRFDSFSRIQRITVPKLFLHARGDVVVPFENGRLLFDSAREPKMFVETGGGHDTAHSADSSGFYGGIMKFIGQLKRSSK